MALPRISFAFQPIADASSRSVLSYEALVRGPDGQGAGWVFSRVAEADLLELDQSARQTALSMASGLGLTTMINLNFLPESLQGDETYIERTLESAEAGGLSPGQLVVEVTEGAAIRDRGSFRRLVDSYRALGVRVAVDDFGAGYSGLNLLADFQPDMVKLDAALVRGIETNGPRQAIVKAVGQVCIDLGIDVIAEGVETLSEYRWLRSHGTDLFQGFLLARPGFERLPGVSYPEEPGRDGGR